ncbi:ABC transporter permease [Afifella sp. IM 167]|uniref:ABC transporter permease n=1 Tax=Afifella sp. IM 167 TaxID=2033586 RepID=UPI001CC995D3|nr:ABC transporter permease [Afifella sp. IM 167]MBZ8131844.1 ABC transporter permease [Afifella sp. IM 167]
MSDATVSPQGGAARRIRLISLDPGFLLLPLLLLLVCVFVLPTFWFFVNSLRETGDSFSQVVKTIFTVLTSATIREVIINTNWIAFVVTLVSLLVAYPLAYVMSRARGLVLSLMVACVVLPYFTSVIVRTYSWMVILGRNGIVNDALLGLGIISSPLQLMYNTTSVVIGMSYVLLPYLVLTLYSSMKAIDPRLLQAARSMGASGFYTFRRIYLPLTLNGIFSGCLIVFILAVGFFITPALMGGPRDVMIAMLIEREVELTLNWPLASIMSLFLLLITLVLYAIYYRFANLQKMMG